MSESNETVEQMAAPRECAILEVSELERLRRAEAELARARSALGAAWLLNGDLADGIRAKTATLERLVHSSPRAVEAKQGEMVVFRLEEDGTIYHYAAHDLQEALETHLEVCGSQDDDTLSIERISEEMARKVQIFDEDQGVTKSAWEWAQECASSSLLGCSEW